MTKDLTPKFWSVSKDLTLAKFWSAKDLTAKIWSVSKDFTCQDPNTPMPKPGLKIVPTKILFSSPLENIRANQPTNHNKNSLVDIQVYILIGFKALFGHFEALNWLGILRYTKVPKRPYNGVLRPLLGLLQALTSLATGHIWPSKAFYSYLRVL